MGVKDQRRGGRNGSKEASQDGSIRNSKQERLTGKEKERSGWWVAFCLWQQPSAVLPMHWEEGVKLCISGKKKIKIRSEKELILTFG